MKSAKAHLQAIADALLLKAADAHVKGMALTRQSAKVEQLGRIAGDESVAQSMLSTLLSQGVVRCIGGEYEVVEDALPLPAEIELTNRNIGTS